MNRLGSRVIVDIGKNPAVPFKTLVQEAQFLIVRTTSQRTMDIQKDAYMYFVDYKGFRCYLKTNACAC